VIAVWCAHAQPPACRLSGQSPGAPFDPRQIEFVVRPTPVADGLSFRVRMIARVVGLNPLVIEVLDNDKADQGGSRTCERRRIDSVDARLRDVLPEVRFGELIQVTLELLNGGVDPLIGTGLESIPGTPLYFHEQAKESVCSNRTGVLLEHRQPDGDTLVVYRDGSVYEQDARSLVFDRLRLGPEEMAQIMQAFGGVGFNKVDCSPEGGRDSITLICARYQQVAISSHGAALAPVLRSLQELRARAIAATHLTLSYEEKREITFRAWPFPELPLEVAEARIRAASNEEFQARCCKRPAQGDFRMYHEELPASFLDQLPIIPPGGEGQPYYGGYFRDGTKIYRVSRVSCPEEPADCRTFYQVHIAEIKAPVIPPASVEPGCSPLARLAAVLWPQDAGIELRGVAAGGQPISSDEYRNDEQLYHELLAAGNCGGIHFVEGNYWYRGVKAVPSR
jgi:hypothetical protein